MIHGIFRRSCQLWVNLNMNTDGERGVQGLTSTAFTVINTIRAWGWGQGDLCRHIIHSSVSVTKTIMTGLSPSKWSQQMDQTKWHNSDKNRLSLWTKDMSRWRGYLLYATTDVGIVMLCWTFLSLGFNLKGNSCEKKQHKTFCDSRGCCM